MKKRIILLLLLAAIAAAGYFGKNWYAERSALEDGELRMYGAIDIRDAGLAFKEQERLAEVLVEEGDQVAAGQVLARLDTERLEAEIAETEARIRAQQEVVKKLRAGFRKQEVEQARAEVEAARVQVTNAEQVMHRVSSTTGTGATSRQAFDDANSRLQVEQAQLKVREKRLDLLLEGSRQEDITAAEHQLAALTAGLQQLTVRLADRTLIAPAGGTIQSRILEPGEMAGPTRPVFTLALDDPKWVRAYLPEPELGLIRPGMRASIFSDSLPGEPIEGWVGFISPVAEFTPRTVQTEDLRTRLVYETRVFVHDEQNRLRLGMPVTVVIDRESMAEAAEQTPPAPSSDPEQR